jgi:hypothetical protein
MVGIVNPSPRFLALLVLLSPAVALAQVNVDLQPGPAGQYAQTLGIDIAELEQQLEDDITDRFAAANTDGFLRAFGNAEAFSAKGLGADYSSNPKTAVVGLGGGVSVSVDNALEDPAVAPGANASILAGMNIGKVEPKLKNLTVYGNFFRFKHEAFAESLKATLTNVGVHAQYKLFQPSGAKTDVVVQWGGFDLTSGLQYTRASMSLGTNALETDLPVVGMELNNAIREEIVPFISTGKFDLTSNAFNIPFEASTNVRIAYFLTFFAGTGIDIQFGKTKMDVELTGNMTAPDGTDLGTGTVTVQGSASPSPGTVRFFGGLQLNIWHAKLLVHANARPKPASAGINFAFRVAW